MNSGDSTDEVLNNLQIDLPALPHTFLMAMGLSREADRLEIDEVVEVIQNDPVVVGRVLRMVNSAYYGLRREVSSIHKAVIVLGPQAVLGIVMSISLIDVQDHLHITVSGAFQKLVKHCVAVGYLASRIVTMSKLTEVILAEEHDFPNEAFMLGLLHDFGKIVLFYNFPDKAIEFYERAKESEEEQDDLLEQEHVLFGTDHVVAGRFFMQELNFLSSMESAVSYHHSYEGDDKHSKAEQYLLNVVVASDKLANTLGLGFNRTTSHRTFKQDAFWDRLIEQEIFDVPDKEALFEALFELEKPVKSYVSELM